MDQLGKQQQQPSKRPLVPIQGYQDRTPSGPQLSSRYRGGGGGSSEEARSASASQENKSATEGGGGSGGSGGGAKVSRKSSFHEIQLKFRSLERKQKEKKEIEKKLEKCLSASKDGNGNGEWPRSDRDTGYVSRDKSRSRDDFLLEGSGSPQESLLNPSSTKRLESYLIRQARAADDFDALADREHDGGGTRQNRQGSSGGSSRLVKRQASRCSSLAAGGGVGSGAGVPGQYRRNMEAVGEFEQVWGGGRGEAPDNDSVPLTKELSAEFRRSKSPLRSGRNSRGPVEAAANQRRQQQMQQQRGRSPESGARNYRRGLSSPAEMRRALSPGGVPRKPRQGPLPPPPLHQLPHRRARSPELRRSSSRVGADSPDPARVLRREKTSMFDSRYPSLDAVKMPDKRMSMAAGTGYPEADMMYPGDRDLRRRSYHELNYPPHLGPSPLDPLLQPQFLHHGPPIHAFQHTGKKKDKSPKPPDYSRYPGLDLGAGLGKGGGDHRMHPPPPPPMQHVLPPGIHRPPPTQWLPAGPPPTFHPMLHPGPPPPGPPQGRFRGAPMRHY